MNMKHIDKVRHWFSGKIYYDPSGAMIFVEYPGGHNQLVLDVRGWGAITKMMDDYDEAYELQDEIGEFVVEAIKEKLEKIKG